MRQYGREDVDYQTWYTGWMRYLAATKTRAQLRKELGMAALDAHTASKNHLKAIEATTSMAGQSARRAHGRNCVEAAGDLRIALEGALEIHDLFPEHACDEMRKCATCGRENPASQMKICMHKQMHRYVCDSQCMVRFYER